MLRGHQGVLFTLVAVSRGSTVSRIARIAGIGLTCTRIDSAAGLLKADREVKSTHQQVVAFSQVERGHVVRMIVADFGTDHEQIVELMADPDRMAGVIGREA